MRVYHGIRDDSGLTHVYLNGDVLVIEPSLKLRNHSPTGFEWGYGGSGPAQLALAILLVETTPIEALAFHQAFKREVIARCQTMGFAFTSENVKEWLDGHRGSDSLLSQAEEELRTKKGGVQD